MILRRLLSFFFAPVIIGTLPNVISNGQPIDAVPVMADLNFIVSQVNSNGAALATTPQLGSANVFTAIQSGVAATGRANFPTAGQIQDGACTYVTSIAGTNTVTGVAPLGLTAYAAGSYYWYVPANSNTGAMQVNWNSTTFQNVLLNGNALTGYETRKGKPVCLFYDGTNMHIVAGAYGGDGIPVGAVVKFGGAATPSSLLLAFGQAISQTTYADLFAIYGSTYGGSGGNFNLPDLRGRTIFGVDNMGGSAANRVTAGVSGIAGTTLGGVGGDQNVQSHTHGAGSFTTSATNTGNDSPAHTHSISSANMVVASNPGTGGGLNGTGDGSGAQLQDVVNGNSQATINANLTGSTGNPSVNHTHSIAALAVSGTSGSTFSGASANMPPTMMMNVGIKF